LKKSLASGMLPRPRHGFSWNVLFYSQC